MQSSALNLVPSRAVGVEPDRSLIRRAQCGERNAFDLLVLKYQHRVLELARRYTRNRADAEDIAQDTFIRAFRALPQFRGDSAFYTWLHRIAINVARDFLSFRARAAAACASIQGDASASPEMSGQGQDTETPEGLMDAEHIQTTVNEALDALPEGHRKVIVLREIHGLKYEEISAALAIPLGTVRSRVFRARELIDERLRAVCSNGLGRHVKKSA